MSSPQTPDSVQQVDIAIIGGGMVGLSLALLLAEKIPRLNIVLVEAFNVAKEQPVPPEFRPSFDARSTALSQSSCDFFEAISLWGELSEHLTSIKNIHVSDRGHFGSTTLNATEEGLPALGYVVENQWLGQVLMAAVAKTPSITMIAPAKPEKIRPFKGGVGIRLSSGQQINAELMVIADGAGSESRELLGISHQVRDYGQNAIVANVCFSRDHHNQAFERFTADGPLALLPLSAFEGCSRSALIWTLPPEQSDVLMAADDVVFLQALQQHFGQRLGRFVKVGQRSSYPIKLVTTAELCRRNIVLVGNAASALHPVAGQGFNLALRGVTALLHQLVEAEKQAIPLGELSILQAYAKAHGGDRSRTILMSDMLPRIFGNQSAPVALGRNTSLLALDAIPQLRSLFSRFATGIDPYRGAM